MSEIKNGILIDNRVTEHTIANIEHGALDLTSIEAIVIHQTGSSSAESTMNAWKTKKEGTHFLIDTGIKTVVGKKTHSGVDGKIYQTAHLDKVCWHIGKVKDKKYPTNKKAIGIEVVAVFDEVKKTYPLPTVAQLFATAWLVETLIRLVPSISGTEKVYAHGIIGYKQPSEGVSTLGGVKFMDLMAHLFPFLSQI